MDRHRRVYWIAIALLLTLGVEVSLAAPDEIKAEIDLPFYEKWAGVNVKTRTENIEHVYGELTVGKKE